MVEMLMVGIGGMIGALLRYGVMSVVTSGASLWIVNSIGSLLLGWLNGYFDHKKASKPFRLMITTGILGAFTTFSTFSAEWFEMLQKDIWRAVGFALGMTVACVGLATVGHYMALRKYGDQK